MAFALKMAAYSASSAPAGRRGGAAAGAVAVAAPGRVVVRALAAAAATAPGRVVIRRHAPAVPAPDRRGLSVSETLCSVREKGKTAFIPYITAGDPDLETTAAALRLLDACGADVIELGMPFSDPYADGPVIQASAARALAAGTTINAVLSMLKKVTPELSCPVVLVTYLGPIVRRGAANFAAAAKDSGVQGLRVHDLPYTEACAFRNEASKNNLEMVLHTTPATPSERMNEITKTSQGFVYLVSVNGVTGPRPTVNTRVKDLIKDIKQVSDKPVAVGFGISTPEHVRQIAGWGADGVIIGSAMVEKLGEAASPREGLRRLEAYARSLKEALP